MRKILSMLKRPKIWLLLVVSILMGTGMTRAQSVDFEKFTLTPEGPYEEVYGLTFTWDAPVKILDESKIYIQGPDYNYYYGGTGLNCSVEGNKLIIDVINGPIVNKTAWEAWTFVGVEDGGISVGGQTLENDGYGVSTQITWLPGGVQLPEPVSVPAWGTTATVSSISEITISWPGFYVASDTGNKNLANILGDIKLYTGPINNKFSPGWNESAFTAQGVASIEGVGTPVQGVWYPQIKITLKEPITDVTHGYTLYIPTWSLLFMEADSEMEISQTDEVSLYYAVAKEIVLPGQYQRVNADNFQGLVIEGGNYTVADASKIKLYRKWYELVKDLSEVTPLASGVDTSSDGKVIISFPEAGKLYDDSYTIYVPAGAITGFTLPVLEGQAADMLQFTIEGNPASIDMATVGSNPENNATVEKIESVKVWWGDYSMLLAPDSNYDSETQTGSLGTVTGQMSVAGGQTQNVTFNIVKTLIETATDEDTGQGDGVDYAYSLVYTPAAPITTPGKYTFMIPANSLKVYINQFSSPANNEVVLNYTIEGTEPEPTVNTLYVAMGPNMDNIVANPATDAQLKLQDDGSFTGKFNVQKGTDNTSFYLYSIAADGTYTYYSCEQGGYGANWKLDYSTDTSIAYNDLMPWIKSRVGSWTVSEYPKGYIGGEISAVVTLPVEVSKDETTPGAASFTLTATEKGKPDLPAELLVLYDSSPYGGFSLNTNVAATFELGEDGTYEGDFTLPSGNSLFKFYAVDNGTGTWYASTGIFSYSKLNFDTQETYTFDKITTATNSAMGVGGWEAIGASKIHAVIDLDNKTVTLSKAKSQEGPGEEEYPEDVYIAWGSALGVSPSDNDQKMLNGEEGIYTASFEFGTSNAKKTFVLYSKDDDVTNYISVRNGANSWGNEENINFSESLSIDYSNLYSTTNGTSCGNWTIKKLPEGVTEGTVELTLDLVNKTLNVTFVPEEVKEPETVYIAFAPNGAAISKDMLNPATDLQFTLQQDGTYLFEYELDAKTPEYFGFLMYTVDGSNYMSIGEQADAGNWGQGANIDLPKPGASMNETYTGLKQYSVGAAYTGDQSSFTFVKSDGFTTGNATLTLSADLKTLEVAVESAASQPEIQLPEMTSVPANGTNVEWISGVAVRWDTLSLSMVNSKAFKVVYNGQNITSDCIMKLEEWAREENEIFPNCWLQIENTDPMFLVGQSGTIEFTINAGAVMINIDGKKVPNEEIVLKYNIVPKVKPTLPEPIVLPADNSSVEGLDQVTLTWNGWELHMRPNEDGTAMLKDVTYTVNGGSPQVIIPEYQGKESEAFAEYYPTLVLPIDAKVSGKYVITIPAGTLYLANEDGGSLENDEIVLTYNVTVPEPVYMTGATISPADGSHLDNMGDVKIDWRNYVLDLGGQESINLPLDGVKVFINGVENTTWKTEGMGAPSMRAANTQESNEGMGGSDSSPIATLNFYGGNMSFFWKGEVNIQLPEGLVKTTTGEISPAFDLTYYVGGYDVVSPAIFTPEDGNEFGLDEAVVYVSWKGYSVTEINDGKIVVNSVDEEGDLGTTVTVTSDKLSIVEGSLKIDLTDLPEGSYALAIYQGAVSLGEDAINADAFYNFSIKAAEVGGQPTDIEPEITFAEGKITISWEGNEIELTDDFNLTLIDNTTGEEVEVPADAVSVDEEGNLVIDIEALELTDGDYTLTLSEGSVNIDEDGTITYNNEVTYNFKSSGIDIITADTDARYFTVNGVEIKNPAPGQILIRVSGTEVEKIIVR